MYKKYAQEKVQKCLQVVWLSILSFFTEFRTLYSSGPFNRILAFVIINETVFFVDDFHN